MPVTEARLAETDRELDSLAAQETIARGRAAARRVGTLDLAAVDSELAAIGEGIIASPVVAAARPAPAPSKSLARDASTLLDVASLFEGVASSELSALDSIPTDLGRAQADRGGQPAEGDGLDLADLLEGEELDVSDIAIELDES